MLEEKVADYAADIKNCQNEIKSSYDALLLCYNELEKLQVDDLPLYYTQKVRAIIYLQLKELSQKNSVQIITSVIEACERKHSPRLTEKNNDLEQVKSYLNKIIEVMKANNFKENPEDIEKIRQHKRKLMIPFTSKRLVYFGEIKQLLREKSENLSEKCVNTALKACEDRINPLSECLKLYNNIKMGMKRILHFIDQQKEKKILALASKISNYSLFGKVQRDIEDATLVPTDVINIILDYLGVEKLNLNSLNLDTVKKLSDLYDHCHEIKLFLEKVMKLNLPSNWSKKLTEVSASLESFIENKGLTIPIRYLSPTVDLGTKIKPEYIEEIVFKPQVWYENYVIARTEIILWNSSQYSFERMDNNVFLEHTNRVKYHEREGFGLKYVHMKLQDSFRILDHVPGLSLWDEANKLFNNLELLWEELFRDRYGNWIRDQTSNTSTIMSF